MIKLKSVVVGVYAFIELSGNSDELQIAVNKFYNHGVIPKIPDTFSKDSENVTVETYRKQAVRGLLSMGYVKHENAPRIINKSKRVSVKPIRASVFAAHMMKKIFGNNAGQSFKIVV